MKRNLENAAFATPYFCDMETRQIGETQDKRAVWQSDSGPPFVVVFDAQGRRSLHAVSPDDFTAKPAPHKTFAEMAKNAEGSAGARQACLDAARKAFRDVGRFETRLNP